MHNKTALFLATNYKCVLIPEFKTSKMIACNDGTKKEFKRNIRLNKRVKFVLQHMSHYKFRLHLENKCKEHKSEMITVTEEYTSQCCSRCGTLDNTYNNRVKTCPSCGLVIDRDINGSRNILIKNNAHYNTRKMCIMPHNSGIKKRKMCITPQL